MLGDPNLCPGRIALALGDYAYSHHEKGDFVMAVLRNDLTEAMGRADAENTEALPHIVAFAVDRLPSICWGSPEKVARWLAGRTA